MTGVQTSILPATNTRGTRVIARWMENDMDKDGPRRSVTVAYDHADPDVAHIDAALMLLAEYERAMNTRYRESERYQYVAVARAFDGFVFVPEKVK